jgi:mxaC protein
MAFSQPAWLWLSPLALLPFLSSLHRGNIYSWNALLPGDALSRFLQLIIRIAGALAILLLIAGLAGLFRGEYTIPRTGHGANLVLLLDRSRSMDDSFAGRSPSGNEESKSRAAVRFLEAFINGRPHDRIGVTAFSTSPLFVLPLSANREAAIAAVRASALPGLAQTHIAKGLAMALSYFADDGDQPSGARGIVLVSDGAAVIDPDSEALLRRNFQQWHPHVYWIFLRTAGTPGLFDIPPPGEDTPQARPERHLHLFFESLGVPYKAYQAENPDDVRQAIADIDRAEQTPLNYPELRPREDFRGFCYMLAALLLLALLMVKRLEIRL